MNVRFLAVGSRLIRQANTFQRNMSAHAVSPCRVGAAAGVARQRLSQPFHRHQRPCTRWQHDGAYGSRGSSIARSSSQSIQQAPAGSLALLAPTLEATATLAELLAGVTTACWPSQPRDAHDGAVYRRVRAASAVDTAGEAQPGDCICLHGPIGAGKSAFRHAVHALLRGLCSPSMPSSLPAVSTCLDDAEPPLEGSDLLLPSLPFRRHLNVESPHQNPALPAVAPSSAL